MTLAEYLYDFKSRREPMILNSRNNHFMAWGKPMLSMHSIGVTGGAVCVGLSLCCTADRTRASYSAGARRAISRAKALVNRASSLSSVNDLGTFMFLDFAEYSQFRKMLRDAERNLGSNAAYHFYRETFFNTERGARQKLLGLKAKPAAKKATPEYSCGFADGIAHAANHMEAWGEHSVAKELRAWRPQLLERASVPANLQDHAEEFATALCDKYFRFNNGKETLGDLVVRMIRTWKPKNV